jgi:hypothetical protein
VQANPDPTEEVDEALAELDRANERVLKAIREATNLDAALAAVKRSYNHMRRLADAHGEVRTEVAGKVWDAQRLSLSALADRVGVSKSRAEQLIKDVRKKGEQQ